jgi:hypothetical protein
MVDLVQVWVVNTQCVYTLLLGSLAATRPHPPPPPIPSLPSRSPLSVASPEKISAKLKKRWCVRMNQVFSGFANKTEGKFLF